MAKKTRRHFVDLDLPGLHVFQLKRFLDTDRIKKKFEFRQLKDTINVKAL